MLDVHTVRELSDMSGIPRAVLHEFVELERVPQEKNLRRLEEWAERAGIIHPSEDGEVAAYTDGPGIEMTSDLERVWLEELRRIGESDASPEQKMFDRDSLASVIAGVAWARAEAAAHERARAVAKVSAAGEARAEALGRRAIPHGPPRPRPGVASGEEEEVA
jgi:hypothetical protein